MHTPPIFAYYSGFTLKTTRLNLLFCVATSECCVLTLMPFLLSALAGAPSGLRKAFPSVVDLLPEVVLIPLPFRVPELINAVRFFQVHCQCSFKASLACQVYPRSMEID